MAADVRIWTLALLCVSLLASPASGRPRRASTKGLPTLLLTFEATNDANTLHQAWFVDGEGHAFAFVRSGGDPLAEAERAGVFTSRDVAALIAASRALPVSIPPGELDRARALLPGAQHSMVWSHRRKDPCPAGVTIAIRGYLWPPGKPAEVVPLRETTCNWLVDENLSPEAQELIDWVYRQSGRPRPRLRR